MTETKTISEAKSISDIINPHDSRLEHIYDLEKGLRKCREELRASEIKITLFEENCRALQEMNSELRLEIRKLFKTTESRKLEREFLKTRLAEIDLETTPNPIGET